MALIILQGNIVEFQADVLVNVITVDTNQLISAGVVSQAFLAAGGTQLQREFEWQSQPKEFGKDVAVTRACGDLKAKFIYHAAAGHYEDENSAKHLYNTIFKCLTMAIKAEQLSIAFPTVGCGKLGFPVTIVADCFTRALKDTGSKTMKVYILTLDDKIYNTLSAIFQHVSYDNVASPENKSLTAETRTNVEKVVEEPANRQLTPETFCVSETATQREVSADRKTSETASTTGTHPNNDPAVQPLQPSDNSSSCNQPPERTKEAASVVSAVTTAVVGNIAADATSALQAQQPPRLLPASQSSLSTAATITSPAQVALKDHVLKILTLNDETVAKLLQKFEDLGVDTPSDILMLTEADVQDCLKTIHFRKLIAATKGTATGFISTEQETAMNDSCNGNNAVTSSASCVAAARPVPLTPKPAVHTDVTMRHAPVRAAGSRQSLEPSTYYSSYAAAPRRASSMIAERAAKFDPSFAGQTSVVHDSNSSREDSTSSSSVGRPSSVLLTAPRGFAPRKGSTVRPVIQSPQQELLPVGDDVVSVPAAAAAADDAKPDIGDQQTSG